MAETRIPGYDPLELMTVEDVAALMQVPTSWVYDQVATGLLKPLRLGRKLRFRRGSLERMLDELESA